jgi:phosphoenolpyruvate-protein phosphotransferase
MREKNRVARKKRRVIKGTPLAEGIASGKIFYYRDILTRDREVIDLTPDQCNSEYRRIVDAVRKVKRQLSRMQKTVKKSIGNKHARIFEMHRTVLDDKQLVAEIKERLYSKMINAEQIIRNVFREQAKKFVSSANEMLREQAPDIADIGRRILLVLEGVEGNVLSALPAHSVIFAVRLLPSDTVHLNARRTQAIITQEGGVNSHSAILAKAMNIPLVSNVRYNERAIAQGTPVIVNGGTGTIVINPRPSELESCTKARTRQRKRMKRIGWQVGKKTVTYRGKKVSIFANISSAHEMKLLRRYTYDGVGLMRIEPIYLASSILPSEDFLFDTLYAMLDSLKVNEVTVRLIDIGGDKALPYLDIGDAQHSLLGLRGIRLLLKYQGLLDVQLRVCLRLSAHFPVKILVPFVSVPQDMIAVRKIIGNMKRKLTEQKIAFNNDIRIGAMVETPSAVFAIDELVGHTDFVSIGSNDLIQYMVAADREKVNVASYYDRGRTLVLKAIGSVIDASLRAGVECTLCGELAGDLKFTERLLKMGLRSFSVLPTAIPLLKQKIVSLR